ncbi:EKC/KEOPS complex subunit Lage3 [Chrysoperla carnea]|uniref:EKC/KEOPS complex subunit Lage3 n=1 Tax=Chrysoperla carnea TaxID=189513 RepID=UPI001D0658F5|nr:EKC/KEOPS complex subunit Lage3 [Chrysoperla carnea]
MMENKNYLIEVSLPFPNPRLAQIAFDVLRVDLEPKRSTAKKEFLVETNHLKLKLSAPDARQLRVALNGFFDNIKLILQTMELTGSPLSESYSHYFG